MDDVIKRISEANLQGIRAMMELLIEKGILTQDEIDARVAKLRKESLAEAKKLLADLFAGT